MKFTVCQAALLAAVFTLTGCSTPFPLLSDTAPPPPTIATRPAPVPQPPRPATPATPAAVAPRAIDATTIEGVSPQAAAAAAAATAPATTGGLRPIPAETLDRPHQVTEVLPPVDLWERIRRGFAMPDLSGELVGNQEQWYATRPDYINRMTERSRKYLFHVVEELERRGMPTELALLPFIESAFNPQAVSSAKAAGMWQFIPSTGRHFDLKQNVFRDDRRDVLASTNAALNYLQKLHGMFGDWHLALAAYNWGEGNVQRAIAKNQKAGLGTAYTDLVMPAETRQYVPKLQAVKNIVANPGSLRVDLPVIENHPYFQRVEIKRDIDVSLAASLAKVPLADFKALNSSAHRPVIFAAGTPQILLPWDNAEVFRRNLDAHDKGQMATWTAWTAPRTMKVADAAKQVGMSEANLRSVNNIPPRYLIKSGSTLLVTRSVHGAHDVSETVADNGQLSLAPEVVLRRVVTKAGSKDSMASVARRYKVSVSSLAEWNKLATGAKLKAGQQLVLFLPPRAAGPVRASARSGTTRKAAPAKTAQRIEKRPAPKRTTPAKKK
ncbi:MAG TPA: transglycosylase SLT domain-containing protein [Burkholderiaceae bacterium]